jgi:hypothetical protein
MRLWRKITLEIVLSIWAAGYRRLQIATPGFSSAYYEVCKCAVVANAPAGRAHRWS